MEITDAFGNPIEVGDRIIKARESGHHIYYKRGVVTETGTDKHIYSSMPWLKAAWDEAETASKRAGKCRPDYCIKLPIK